MMTLTHKFVDQIPEELEDGVLYVSIPFATVIHKCGCGCGREVVTPLSPTDWSLTFDGETITLDPSIGNWNFECKSHYFIRNNKVIWARRYNEIEIKENKDKDSEDRQRYYSKNKKKKRSKKNNTDKPTNRKSISSKWLTILLGNLKK